MVCYAFTLALKDCPIHFLFSYPSSNNVDDDNRFDGYSTVDDALFKNLALAFSSKNKKMFAGNGCGGASYDKGLARGKLTL